MGTVLYRPGASRKIRGIACELRVFDGTSVQDALVTGWAYTPESCYELTEVLETDGLLEIDAMSDSEIRLVAKEKGISHWHNKNIERLREEVDAWQPED